LIGDVDVRARIEPALSAAGIEARVHVIAPDLAGVTVLEG